MGNIIAPAQSVGRIHDRLLRVYDFMVAEKNHRFGIFRTVGTGRRKTRSRGCLAVRPDQSGTEFLRKNPAITASLGASQHTSIILPDSSSPFLNTLKTSIWQVCTEYIAGNLPPAWSVSLSTLLTPPRLRKHRKYASIFARQRICILASASIYSGAWQISCAPNQWRAMLTPRD